MKLFYIYAHPNPASFNAQLKNHALSILNEHQVPVSLSDLYAKNFNPIASWNDFSDVDPTITTQYFVAQKEAFTNHKLAIDINNEIKNICDADHLIFQFPLWWFSVPAILKGWFDRIWVKGFAYDSGKIFDQGLLKGKSASLVLTTQSPLDAYQEMGIHRSPIETFLYPVIHMLRFAGITVSEPFVAYGAFNLNSAKQKQIIQDYENYLLKLIKN